MDDKDLEIYNFIISYIKENGYAPTYREIGKGVGMAASMVIPHIWLLELQGRIKTKPKAPRAIHVVGYKFVKDETDKKNSAD